MLVSQKQLSKDKFETVFQNFHKFKEKDKYSPFGLINLESILEKEEFENIKSNIITIPALVPLIAQSLYGNPRQIKRFLNTYTLRRRLAGVASISDFQDTVLAKIMILEYSELPLFRKLFEWQSNQNGMAKEIEAIESLCQGKSLEEAKNSLENSEYKDWAKNIKVIKWIQTEPQLSIIDLRDYFWLSREKVLTSLSLILTPIVKNLFSELDKEITDQVREKIILSKFKLLTQLEQNSFFSLLIDKIVKEPKKDRLHNLFILMIEMKIEGTESNYVEALTKIKTSDINISIKLRLKNYATNKDIGAFLTEYFKNDSTFTKKLKTD